MTHQVAVYRMADTTTYAADTNIYYVAKCKQCEKDLAEYLQSNQDKIYNDEYPMEAQSKLESEFWANEDTLTPVYHVADKAAAEKMAITHGELVPDWHF